MQVCFAFAASFGRFRAVLIKVRMARVVGLDGTSHEGEEERLLLYG